MMDRSLKPACNFFETKFCCQELDDKIDLPISLSARKHLNMFPKMSNAFLNTEAYVSVIGKTEAYVYLLLHFRLLYSYLILAQKSVTLLTRANGVFLYF